LDDLSALLGSQDKDKDLVDKLIKLLDRQTDHKVTPNTLLGFLGMFNILSIMSIVRGNAEPGIREITGSSEGGKDGPENQGLTEVLSGLMQGQGSGQPDLLGLLSGLASKKKINPNLLLSLFSMLNNQGGTPAKQTGGQTEDAPAMEATAVLDEGEKKSSDDKHGVELKYDRRRGSGERS
jgi:hypothetical protein